MVKTMEFHVPTMEDMAWAKPILLSANRQGCEYAFGNIICWNQVYKTKITRWKDFFISCSDNGSDTLSYSYPAGQGDILEVLAQMQADAAAKGKNYRIYGAMQAEAEALCAQTNGALTMEARRDSFDYIYLTQNLATLSGKKYHGKRNHIAAFENSNNWSYEEITHSNMDDCYNMYREWLAANEERNPDGLEEEKSAITRCLEEYFNLNCRGGLIRIDGKVIAFTMGERQNDNTFCTHYEKAFADIRGAYQIINREFAKNTLCDFQYVNREEDLGEEGLRKAKLSYRPDILLEKYVLTPSK